MKIIRKFLLTTSMFIFLLQVGIAKDSSVFSVQHAGKNSISLQVINTNENQIQVTLKDAYNFVLLDETLSATDINHRTYDLNKLPRGTYSLMVAYDNIVKIQKINKTFTQVEIEEDKLQTIFQPSFVEHSEYLDLSVLSLSKEDISLKILDSKGRILYSKRNQIKGSFQKRFNLSKVERGMYTFVVEYIGSNFNKEFKKSIQWSPTIDVL